MLPFPKVLTVYSNVNAVHRRHASYTPDRYSVSAPNCSRVRAILLTQAYRGGTRLVQNDQIATPERKAIRVFTHSRIQTRGIKPRTHQHLCEHGHRKQVSQVTDSFIP